MSQLLAWIYNKTQTGFGIEAAQVGLAGGVAVMLLVITFGVRLASKIDQAIRDERCIFSSMNRGIFAKVLMRIWGYQTDSPEEASNPEPETNSGLEELGLTYDEAMDLINQTRKRGRRPDFTLERWLPVTVKWETRDL